MSIPGAVQSALDPHGPEAAGIAQLTWILVGGGTLVMVLVVVLAALALRAPRPWLAQPRAIVAGGIVLPTVVLLALLVYALLAVPRSHAHPPELAIEVVGHQWWWEVAYLDAQGGREIVTANEIRIPVGRSVELRLATADVLHSFWVPALAGKLDLVPGKDNRLRITADRPGRYRGQCAEYCGGPHALMALLVVAEDDAGFEAWRAAQRAPQRVAPATAPGERAFLARCGACHAVRGTRAAGAQGPDLTHLASRATLGAGVLANDRAGLAHWIVANQHVKPGNLMPEFGALDAAEREAILDFVAALE